MILGKVVLMMILLVCYPGALGNTLTSDSKKKKKTTDEATFNIIRIISEEGNHKPSAMMAEFTE